MSITVERCEDMNIIFPLVENLFREIIPGFKSLKAEQKESFLNTKQNNSIKHQSFVAYDGEKAIGFLNIATSLSLFARGEYGIINELWTQSNYRSQGVGLQLLQASFDYAKASGWKRLDVAAPIDNVWKRTIRFYEKNDFAKCGIKLRKWL